MSGEGAGYRGGCLGRLVDPFFSAYSHLGMVRLLGRSRWPHHADPHHSFSKRFLSQFLHRDRAALDRSKRPADDRKVAAPRHALSPDHGNIFLTSSRKVFYFLVSDSARSVRILSGVALWPVWRRHPSSVHTVETAMLHRTMWKALKSEETSRHDRGVELKTYEGGATR